MTQTLIEQLEKLQKYAPNIGRDMIYSGQPPETLKWINADDLRAIIEQHKQEVGGKAVIKIHPEGWEYGEEPAGEPYTGGDVAVLALKNTELSNRISVLEDLLSSAYCIANRNGEGTHWQRFASRLHVHGISPVTAKTFHILPSDEGYVPDRTAQLETAIAERDEEIERLQSYEQGLNEVIAWMEERGLYHDADYFGEGADFAAILTEHEHQVIAKSDRKLDADNKRLVEALTSTNGFLDASSCFQLQQLNSNAAILAEMEAKG